MLKKSPFYLLLALLDPSGPALADVITVLNPGFEEPVHLDGDFGLANDWTEGHYDPAAPRTWIVDGVDGAGNWNPDPIDGFTNGAAFAGENIAWVTADITFDSGLAQILPKTLEANREYTLEVQVGNSFYNAGDTADYRLELLAGGTLLASSTGSAPVTDTWELKTLTYNSGPSPAQHGQALEIRLIAVNFPESDDHEIEFDEVSLTSVSSSAAGIVITNVSKGSNTITLTWKTRPGRTYAIFASSDLVSFDLEVDDSVTAASDENPDDGNHVTYTFQNPTITPELPGGAAELYLQIEDLTSP